MQRPHTLGSTSHGISHSFLLYSSVKRSSSPNLQFQCQPQRHSMQEARSPACQALLTPAAIHQSLFPRRKPSVRSHSLPQPDTCPSPLQAASLVPAHTAKPHWVPAAGSTCNEKPRCPCPATCAPAPGLCNLGCLKEPTGTPGCYPQYGRHPAHR